MISDLTKFIGDLWNESWIRYLLLVDILGIVFDILNPMFNLNLVLHVLLFNIVFAFSVFQVYRTQLNKIKILKNNSELPKPQLLVGLINQGGDLNDYKEVINLQSNEHQNKQHVQFGLILMNLAEGTVAEDINVRLEISWSGNDLQYSPNIKTARDSPWTSDYGHISEQGGHATLLFAGTSRDRVPYKQPLTWKDFRAQFSEKVKGSLLIDYTATSARPFVQNTGRLKVNISSD